MKYSNNQVGGVYKRPADVQLDSETTLINIVASAVGTLGVASFILALAALPWGVL